MWYGLWCRNLPMEFTSLPFHVIHLTAKSLWDRCVHCSKTLHATHQSILGTWGVVGNDQWTSMTKKLFISNIDRPIPIMNIYEWSKGTPGWITSVVHLHWSWNKSLATFNIFNAHLPEERHQPWTLIGRLRPCDQCLGSLVASGTVVPACKDLQLRYWRL